MTRRLTATLAALEALLVVGVGLSIPLALGTVLALTAYGIFSCIAASQLTPPTEAEQWFPDDHIYSKALKSMDKFLSGDDDSYALFKVRVPAYHVPTVVLVCSHRIRRAGRGP